MVFLFWTKSRASGRSGNWNQTIFGPQSVRCPFYYPDRIERRKTMKNEYLKCPKCGCESFIEFANQVTLQDGVRLQTKTGEAN